MLAKIDVLRRSHATYSGKLSLLGSTVVIQSLSKPIIRSRKA